MYGTIIGLIIAVLLLVISVSGVGRNLQLPPDISAPRAPASVIANTTNWYLYYRDNVSNINDYIGQKITFFGYVPEIDRIIITDINGDFRSLKNTHFCLEDGTPLRPGDIGVLVKKDTGSYYLKK